MPTTKEVWKDIKNYKGLYQISNYGNVKSLQRKINNRIRKERKLKLFDDGHGYLQVVLQKNKTKKTFKVHRLVAEEFVPNICKKNQVNHLDMNRKNNFFKNLEWCTSFENILYASKNSVEYQKRRKAVIQFKENKEIKRWNSMAEAEHKLNICKGSISKVCKGYRKSCGGYSWKLIEEEV